MTERSYIDIIGDNLSYIREEMCRACCQANRPEDAVQLLAVTKTVDPQRINAAIQLGVDRIGENRVQEFLCKQADLKLEQVEAHLIGLQQSIE